MSQSANLGSLQELFVELEAKWISWVLSLGYKLRHGEGRILQNGPRGVGRRTFLRNSGIVYVKDLVHKEGSAHYNGVGADWNLFVNGKWIEDGDSPAWIEIGKYWKSLHELCRWGGDWGDANHISLEYNGIK